VFKCYFYIAYKSFAVDSVCTCLANLLFQSHLHRFRLQMLTFSYSLTFYTLEQDTHLLLTGGVEKILRIYDMNRPDAPPREVDKSPGSVRTVAWLHSDQTILSSCTDMGGVRYIFHLVFNAESLSVL